MQVCDSGLTIISRCCPIVNGRHFEDVRRQLAFARVNWL